MRHTRVVLTKARGEKSKENTFLTSRIMPPNVKHETQSIAAGEISQLARHRPTTVTTTVAENVANGTDNHNDTIESSEWVCPPSAKSLRTTNPIREIVDPIVASSVKCGKDRGDGKDQISLALGDPTVYGNLPPCPAALNAILSTLQSPCSGAAAGYVNACGAAAARESIASHHSRDLPPQDRVTADNVIVANGCSGALELALTALLDEGSVLLVPRPGFPLYQVIAESHGAKVVGYDLLPERGWEIDLDSVEEIFKRSEWEGKGAVRGIVVNNPSNPTGSVYSELHLMDICRLAARYRVPIVADEIYGDMTFGSNFFPLANVAAKLDRNVPVIAASGLGKQYLVPGWRVGWIVFHDSKSGSLRKVERGAKRLAQVVLGASHLIQCAIPAVLTPSMPQEGSSIDAWKKGVTKTLARQATFTYDMLSKCPGLTVIPPQGAMYIMVKINIEEFDDSITDDVSFSQMLMDEENVFVLPGKAFGCSSKSPSYNAFRVVFCAPEEILAVAFCRIGDFCVRHTRS